MAAQRNSGLFTERRPFLGYRGIARREGGRRAPCRPLPAARAPAGDAEALRETIHEIKTPLNAIIGFAEIIDGQYLGPAHRNYRERAAEIVAQARTLLAAIEDLDFAARLRGRKPGEANPLPSLKSCLPLPKNGPARRRAAGWSCGSSRRTVSHG